MASGHEQTIWNYLKSKIGNEYGTAALMGNLYAESGLYPDRVQGDIPYSSYSQTYTAQVDNGTISEYDFVHNGPNGGGYGLAQWTYYTRKQALYDLKQSGGYSSIGSIDLALDYLWYEMQNLFPSVLAVLKSASSIREASDKVLHDFEAPADQSTSVEETRASLGQDFYDQFHGTGGSSVAYTPRLTSDGLEGNHWYYEDNPFYKSGYGLPNCTAYAWGRWAELMDSAHSLPLGNANEWWYQNTTYEEGQTPKLGAVICWAYDGNEGGHVAIVEQINPDGSIVTSNSAYSGTYFYTQTLYPEQNYEWSEHTNFQGFIYFPIDFGNGTGEAPDNPSTDKKRKGLSKLLLFAAALDRF